MNATQQNGFVAQPGQGWLLFNKRVDENLALWQGSLTLADGTPAQLRAKVISAPKPHYEVEVVQIGAPGEQWPTLARFKMKPFGKQRAQDIIIPTLGKAKAWTAKTRTQRNAVRFQLINAPAADEEIL